MSPRLADEARVVKIGKALVSYGDATVNSIAHSNWGLHRSYRAINNGVSEEEIREAARRELLRRSLFGGKV